MKTLTVLLIIVSLASAVSLSQSGGTFELKQTALGGAGGSMSGGNFDVTLGVGQDIAGNDLVGPPFAITSGFFNFTPLGTTAASVSISGRVVAPTGGGVRNVRVTLTSPIRGSMTVLTTTFGNYRFDNVPIGETYIISVASRRYSFDRPSRIVSVVDEVTNLDFIAQEN